MYLNGVYIVRKCLWYICVIYIWQRYLNIRLSTGWAANTYYSLLERKPLLVSTIFIINTSFNFLKLILLCSTKSWKSHEWCHIRIKVCIHSCILSLSFPVLLLLTFVRSLLLFLMKNQNKMCKCVMEHNILHNDLFKWARRPTWEH